MMASAARKINAGVVRVDLSAGNNETAATFDGESEAKLAVRVKLLEQRCDALLTYIEDVVAVTDETGYPCGRCHMPAVCGESGCEDCSDESIEQCVWKDRQIRAFIALRAAFEK